MLLGGYRSPGSGDHHFGPGSFRSLLRAPKTCLLGYLILVLMGLKGRRGLLLSPANFILQENRDTWGLPCLSPHSPSGSLGCLVWSKASLARPAALAPRPHWQPAAPVIQQHWHSTAGTVRRFLLCVKTRGRGCILIWNRDRGLGALGEESVEKP